MDSDVLSLAQGSTPAGFEVIKSFEDIYKESMCKKGYLFITRTGSSPLFYHAGVCCGEDEIIHFTQNTAGSSGSFACSGNGMYSKTSVKLFSSNNGIAEKFKILKKKVSLPADFDTRVKRAMNSSKQYNLATYNCIHFALELIR